MLTALSFLVSLVLSAAIPSVLVWLALLRWKRLPPEPWTERARALHPIRKGHGAWTFASPLVAVVCQQHLLPEESPVPALVGAILGGVISGWPLDKTAFPAFSFRSWFRAASQASVIRSAWLALTLAFALSIPHEWSVEHAYWIIGYLIAAGALASGLLQQAMHLCGIFRPANERLAAIVKAESDKANVRVNAVWMFDSPAGYAAALLVQRTLLFSSTTVDEHDDGELRAICRHELAHLTEIPAVVALRLVTAPLTIVPFVLVPAFYHSWRGAGVAGAVLLSIAIARGVATLSLRLEKRADRIASNDDDSPVYARALERIYRRNLVAAVFPARARRTHPDLYDRMVAAGVTPEYPRPLPPNDNHWLVLSAQIASGVSAVLWLLSLRAF